MKRIFLALALLPALSLPAMAEDGKTGAPTYNMVQLQIGIAGACERGRAYRFAYIEESKTFAVCDGENWREVVLGNVIVPEKTNSTEGAKK
jgi:hypothetical protein